MTYLRRSHWPWGGLGNKSARGLENVKAGKRSVWCQRETPRQQDDEQIQNSLALLADLVEKQIQSRPKYRCIKCGFSGRQVYWLCPACKHWSVVKPIKGLDGE